MILTQEFLERPWILFAADTVTFDTGDPPHVWLIQQPFTPGPNLIPGDLVQADFVTYAAVQCDSTAVHESIDPATGDVLVDIPAGSTPFAWETTALTNLPQTIYGYAFLNDANTKVICAALFDDPITLTAINQSIVLPRTYLRVFAGAVT